MGRPDLNRRQLLAAAGGLAVAGGFGYAALGTGADALASGADTRVRYWNLFSGGDGYNMIAMLDTFRKGTGKALPDATVHHLATRPDAPYAVEGPYIVKHGHLLPAGHGRYVGTGGQSVFRDRGEDWLAYHYYDAEDNGTPKLGLNRLNRLNWKKDGWPSLP